MEAAVTMAKRNAIPKGRQNRLSRAVEARYSVVLMLRLPGNRLPRVYGLRSPATVHSIIHAPVWSDARYVHQDECMIEAFGFRHA